jgi:hypothetical protein
VPAGWDSPFEWDTDFTDFTDFFFEPGRRLNFVDELAEVNGLFERVQLHPAMIRLIREICEIRVLFAMVVDSMA